MKIISINLYGTHRYLCAAHRHDVSWTSSINKALMFWNVEEAIDFAKKHGVFIERKQVYDYNALHKIALGANEVRE